MNAQNSVSCSVIRGGTSKGLYFLEDELPTEEYERNQFLLAVMGSPDSRQIDGMGGAHPLTSKVAIVRPSSRDDADVDYLFLQISVDSCEVSNVQNCGNILAGVGPYAIEQGLVQIESDQTDVRIYMQNTGSLATARVHTPNNAVQYAGSTKIDGVPGSASPISIEFLNIEGSSCGALFPTGKLCEQIEGINLTCVDMGMPVVLINATSFGLTGDEPPKELESNQLLKTRIEAIRLKAGTQMNLGDVSHKTVPKMCLISPAKNGGLINTRTFIPHRVHEAIGVLGSVSVATASLIPGTIAFPVANSTDDEANTYSVEHPTGSFDIDLQIQVQENESVAVTRAALVRTARLLMRGEIFASEYQHTYQSK